MDQEVLENQESFDQSANQTITTDEIKAKGMINQANAEKIYFSDGLILMAQSGSLDLNDGVIGLGNVQSAKLTDSGSFLLFAEHADLEESSSVFMITRTVSADKVKTGLLLASRVDAPVETTIDGPRALMAGFAFGAGLGLILSIARLLFGQKTQ